MSSKKKLNKFNGKALAKAILNKRISDDLSFRTVFAQTGIPATSLSNIEAVKTVPTAQTLQDICNWLEIEVQTFFKP